MSKTHIIDVRSIEEYKDGCKENAINIPVEEIYHNTDYALNLLKSIDKKEDTLHLYCASGSRAELAKHLLQNMGFEKVVNLGGF